MTRTRARWVSIAVATLLAAGAASAQPVYTQSTQLAYTNRDVNVRAGPNREFPLVMWVPGGVQVYVNGCVDGWTWCDISVGDQRGWVYADFLSYQWSGQPVTVFSAGPVIGLPLISFSIGSYWDNYYRYQPWYGNRYYWYNRPPTWWHRPPPPPPPRPIVRPPPPRPPNWSAPPPRPPSGGRPPPNRPPDYRPPSQPRPPTVQPQPMPRPPTAQPQPRPPSSAPGAGSRSPQSSQQAQRPSPPPNNSQRPAPQARPAPQQQGGMAPGSGRGQPYNQQ